MTYSLNPALWHRFQTDAVYQRIVLSWARGTTLRAQARSIVWAVADPVWD